MIIEAILALALAAPADPVLKCPRTNHLPGMPEASAVVLIDGEIHGNSETFSTDDFDTSSIERIDIVCWNPATDEIPASRGIQLIVITTKSRFAEAKAATLEAARRLHAFVAEHDEVPTSLEALGADLNGYSVEVGPLGWTLDSADIDGIECTASELGSEAGEVRCSNTYSGAKETLREAWATGAPGGG